MKNLELFELYNGLEAVSNIGGARFAYWVAKNKKIIQAELKLIESINEPTDWYKQFEQRRVSLCQKMATKDENWEPKIVWKSYDIEDIEAFNVELEELKKEHKSNLEEMEKKNQKYEELLNQDVTIDFFTIKQEIIPEGITAKLLDPIMAVIE